MTTLSTRLSFLVAGCLFLALGACGGGSNISSETEAEAATWIETWPLHFRLDNTTYVGSGGVLGGIATAWLTDYTRPRETSSTVWDLQRQRHGETSLVHGRFRNGVGREYLAAYLRADAEESSRARLQRFGHTPPVVKTSYGTSDRDWYELRMAVRMINAALPDDYQLRLSDDRTFTPSSWRGAEEGEIIVSFARQWEWTGCQEGSPIGCAVTSTNRLGEIASAEVWIKEAAWWDDDVPTDGRNERLTVIVHELLHALGREHPDPYKFPDTIMRSVSFENSGFILYQLDREALLAVYSRFDVGTWSEDVYRQLGPWEDTSVVVMGGQSIPGGSVAFGAAEMNDHVHAWAYGPVPLTNLQDNRELRDVATWRGRLLGMTPQSETVGGTARLTVQLATLDGNLGFTGLESWRPGAAPGAVGTGTTWHDGDLHYPIEVWGSSFSRTWESGDEGTVSGSFFGIAHEGMGGVLKRDDLTAGFGGKR